MSNLEKLVFEANLESELEPFLQRDHRLKLRFSDDHVAHVAVETMSGRYLGTLASIKAAQLVEYYERENFRKPTRYGRGSHICYCISGTLV